MLKIREFIINTQRYGTFNVSSFYYFLVFFAMVALAVSVLFAVFGVNWMTILATFLAALFCAWISNLIFQTLAVIVEDIFREFQADPTARIQIQGSNELGTIAAMVNDLLDRNASMRNEINSANERIRNLMESLNRQLVDNAEASSTQSSSIAQTTATIKELAASAQKIVEETTTVVTLAEATQESAQKGTQAIANMLERMSEIQNENQRRIHEIVILGKKAQETEKVMDIINDIASNTKIIAFNAGIEAASSGEEGKRFGTVATEIRKLANTVSNSTAEIRDKIKEIQKTTNELVIVSEEETKKIQNGVETAQTMVKELTEILDKADKTLDWVKQISLATQQQLTASEQVAVVLHDISDGVRRFSTAINSTRETSEELKQLAGTLQSITRK